MDCIVHGILRATILEWVAFPFSRGSSQPRYRTQVSCITGGFFSSWAIREIILGCVIKVKSERCFLCRYLAEVERNFFGYRLNLAQPQGLSVAQTVKNPPAMQETWVWPLGGLDPLGKGMTTHPSILAWRIPWTEEPGGLQSVGSRRVRHNWVTDTLMQTVSRWSGCPSAFSSSAPLPYHTWRQRNLGSGFQEKAYLHIHLPASPLYPLEVSVPVQRNPTLKLSSLKHIYWINADFWPIQVGFSLKFRLSHIAKWLLSG